MARLAALLASAAAAAASPAASAASPAACRGKGPLKYTITGIQCLGLTAGAAKTAAACEAACCESETCLTWVFSPAAGSGGCWSGALPCTSASPSSKGWNGSSKLPIGAPPPPPPPPPTPPPFVMPRLAPRPSAVAGVPKPIVSLHGTWDFKPSREAPDWLPMRVPAEYTMEGFRVASGVPVLYRRNFTLPTVSEKLGKRIKLRADGCYSQCNVAINGKPVGSHLGGFTPFELDITAALSEQPEQEISIQLTGASLADTMASASQYASHDLGGITRKIYVMVLPDLSIADVNYTTVSASAGSATVATTVTLANDGAATSATTEGKVLLTLCRRGAPIPAHLRPLEPANCKGLPTVATKQLQFEPIAAGQLATKDVTFELANPALWDAEHPHLYTLQVDLDGGKQQTALRMGIRTLQLAGNQVLVNGKPIKGRGTTRHETHPLFGRSLWGVAPEGGQWERDIIAFRDLNVNWVRTSHYPPAEELMEAADELGMFIELEMPLCWDRSSDTPQGFLYTIQVHMEAVTFNRHHASVIAWSLANESPWGPTFTTSLNSYIKRIDNSRPFMFDGGSGQTMRVQGGQLDIQTWHYPGLKYDFASNASFPISFGEFAHLNCYNHRELLTDTGIRVNWAVGVQQMIEHVLESTVLGACYWAGIDDQFYMPAVKDSDGRSSRHLVGYGPWGIIDNFRRMKPESIASRNMYSPFVIEQVMMSGGIVADLSALTVHNRFDFTDLSELTITWRSLETAVGGDAAVASSGVGHARGAPHTRGQKLVLDGLTAATKRIELNVTSPRGFLVNTWHLESEESAAALSAPLAIDAPPVAVKVNADGSLEITAGAVAWVVSAQGSVSAALGHTPLIESGPTLMVLEIHKNDFSQLTEDNDRSYAPATDTLQSWTPVGKPRYTMSGSAAVVSVRGSYPGQADGSFQMTFEPGGGLKVAFDFAWRGSARSPRQIGVVFSLPGGVDHLSWKRRGQFSYYSPSDIGRNVGTDVRPGACGTYFGFSGDACGYSPATLWSHDSTPMGSNDFRSTKDAILGYSLCAQPEEKQCVRLVSNGTANGQPGTLSARSWLNGSSVKLLAATLSNEGGNSFTQPVAVLPHVNLAPGSPVAGEVQLQVA